MKKSAIFLLSIFACYADDASMKPLGVAATEQTCDAPVCLPPAQMVLSHNFGRGVGHKGYSSADFFFIRANASRFYPFADFRLHVMDSGKIALNAGVGFRCLTLQDNLSVGANFYYDYRNSSHLQTSQVAAGLEFLSQHVDFRFNGYVPVSDRKYAGSLKFAKFSGHTIRTKRGSQYAFPSLNAEVGVPLPWLSSKYVDTYVGVGPYYLFGKDVSKISYQNSWGGKFRMELGITDYLTLKFELNHDNIFRTTCQGVVALNIPLYKKTACAPTCRSYGKEAYLKRTLRPVMRNEIIPVKSKTHKSTLKNEAGNEYLAFFVNSLAACPGNGTFESPFCQLSSAEAAAPSGPVLIYVFEGAPYLGSFVMKEGQTLQGSGAALTLNDVTIPPFTSGNPVITSAAAPAVTLASFTTVQGLTIQNQATNQDGIASSNAVNVSNVNIMRNIIHAGTADGIRIGSLAGNLYVAYNDIQGANDGITIVNIPLPSVVQIVYNNVSNATAGGITFLNTSGPQSALVAYNTLYNIFGPGIGGVGSAQITYNKLTHIDVNGIEFETTGPSSLGVISYNTLEGGTGGVANIVAEAPAGGIIITEYNQITSGKTYGIRAGDGTHIIQNNFVYNTAAASTAIEYDTVLGGAPPGTINAAYIYNNIATVTAPNSTGIRSGARSNTGSVYTEVVGNTATNTSNIAQATLSVDAGAGGSTVCAYISGNTTNASLTISGSGAGSAVNVRQTQPELLSQNTADSILPSGTFTFGSSCTPP